MKRKFVKVMFFGALALSTVTYVGCKDYDDDIDNLQTQIDANKASIADLQKFVDAGNWVTKVDDITNGFRITFNNGKTYDVVNGKDGEPGVGQPGESSTVTISETGEWLINGKPTGWSAHAPYIQGGYWYYWSKSENDGKGGFVKGDKAKGEDGQPGVGTPGADGFSPYIANGNNGDKGYWYFYEPDNSNAIASGELKGWVKGPFTEATITLTKSADKPCWTLKQDLGDGTEKTVILPTADNLISLKGVNIIDGKIETAGTKEVTLYYGEITEANGVKFGDPEVTYAKGTLLTSNSAVINTLINPSDIDLAQYSIKLQDSHGNTCYTLSQPKQNMSSTPLTRADEWNRGIYDLTISFAEGVKKDAIKDGVAYALATENAWGKTIMSEYDVNVVADGTTAPALGASYTIDAPFNEVNVLDELVKSAGETNLENVAAYYYEFSNLPKTVTFDKTKNTISSTVGQTVPGTLHYLTVNGTKGETNLTLNFKSVAPEVVVPEMNWTVNTKAADAKITLPAEIKNLLDDQSGNYSLIYANGSDLLTPGSGDIAFAKTPVKVDGKDVNYIAGSISLTLTDNAQAGDKKVYYLTPTFQNDKVTATSHIVKLVVKNSAGSPLLGTDVVRTINMKVNIAQDNSKIFVFNPLTAFFDESKKNASGYGVPNTVNSNVDYDLYSLFETITDKANISFVAGTWTVASGKASIPYSDISKGSTAKKHDLTIAYQPFGNTNLAKIQYPFTLAVWSEIERGTHGTVTGKFLSEAQREQTLKLEDFKWKDSKAASITLATDSRIKSVTLELSDEAKNYMELDETDFKSNTTIKVTMKNDVTQVATEIPGSKSYVTVKVVDTWGVTTSVKVEIPIKKS